jgi:type IV pilus assembly protein PilF
MKLFCALSWLAGCARAVAPISVLCSLLLCSVLAACSSWPWRSSAAVRQPAFAQVNAPAPVSDDARRAQLRLELATAYFERGQIEVALEELEQSLALDGRNAQAYNLQGLIALRQQQPERAEESLRKALALDAENGDIQHNYGYLLCQMQRYAQAQQRFELALANARYSGRDKTLLVSALCQTRAGELARAETVLRELLERQPALTQAHLQLADVLYLQRRFDEARRQLRPINNSDQASAASLWLGLRVEQAQGQTQTAQQLAEQLRRRFPDSPELRSYDNGNIED